MGAYEPFIIGAPARSAAPPRGENTRWATQAHAGASPAGGRPRTPVVPQQSLVGVRAAAILIDCLVLALPVLAATWIAGQLFPGHGFWFFNSAGSTGATHLVLPFPGVLLTSAVSLGYFFLGEALYGRTVGKRSMRLRVVRLDGQAASVNAISGRTVLRLIDGIGFYLVGSFVSLFTGLRRRRIGDLAAGTVVVRDDGSWRDPPRTATVYLYPLGWLIAVLAAVLALGIGTAAGADEQAIALVHRYIAAREAGDANGACAMLTRGEQRELAAIDRGDFRSASAAMCPHYILGTDPNSNLQNPALAALDATPLVARYSQLGAVVVQSPTYPTIYFAAVQVPGGEMALDVRGYNRLLFVKGCSASGRFTTALCTCAYDGMRMQGTLYRASTPSDLITAARQSARRCQLGLSRAAA